MESLSKWMATKRSVIAYDEIEDRICKKKKISICIPLGLLGRISLLELIQQESIIKRSFCVTLQFDPHLVYGHLVFPYFS